METIKVLENKIEVRAMNLSDVAGVAEVHQKAFPNYFLTKLGLDVLQAFYSEFIIQSVGFASVALEQGKPIGFVVGTISSSELYDRFYKKNFLLVARNVVRCLITDSFIRQHFRSRLLHVQKAIMAKLMRTQKSTTKSGPSRVQARLLSIGITSEARGTGSAEKMTKHFLQQLQKASIKEVGLSVFRDNIRAISFYEKTGWKRELEMENAVYFSRSTSD